MAYNILFSWASGGDSSSKDKRALAQRGNSDLRDEEIEDLKKIVGDLSLVIDTLKKGFKGVKMMVIEYLKLKCPWGISQGQQEYHSLDIITNPGRDIFRGLNLQSRKGTGIWHQRGQHIDTGECCQLFVILVPKWTGRPSGGFLSIINWTFLPRNTGVEQVEAISSILVDRFSSGKLRFLTFQLGLEWSIWCGSSTVSPRVQGISLF